VVKHRVLSSPRSHVHKRALGLLIAVLLIGAGCDIQYHDGGASENVWRYQSGAYITLKGGRVLVPSAGLDVSTHVQTYQCYPSCPGGNPYILYSASGGGFTSVHHQAVAHTKSRCKHTNIVPGTVSYELDCHYTT
jgi:hypothetical protein